MPPHPLTNFEIRRYYQNEPKFTGFYARNSLPKVKGGVYIINLDDCKSKGTYWIALHVNSNVSSNNGSASYSATYFDSFEVEHITKEIEIFIGNKNYSKYLYNTAIQFDKVWILFYWSY